MPLTFPSHAAAVLPLMGHRTRFLPPVALVVGTIAPDLGYLFGAHGPASHVPSGILTFSLPMGVIFYLWLEVLVLPALAQTLPRFLKLDMPAVFRPRGLPATPRGWLAVGLAIVLGAASHLLWDGFTHNWMWPASLLYPEVTVPLLGRVYPIARVFQYACHLLGGAIVIAYAYRLYADERAPWLPRWRSIGPWLAWMAIPGALGLGLKLQSWQPVNSLEQTLWIAFWPTVGGMLIGMTLYASYLRLRAEAPVAAR